jgi:hypothetical protein
MCKYCNKTKPNQTPQTNIDHNGTISRQLSSAPSRNYSGDTPTKHGVIRPEKSVKITQQMPTRSEMCLIDQSRLVLFHTSYTQMFATSCTWDSSCPNTTDLVTSFWDRSELAKVLLVFIISTLWLHKVEFSWAWGISRYNIYALLFKFDTLTGSLYWWADIVILYNLHSSFDIMLVQSWFSRFQQQIFGWGRLWTLQYYNY